MTISDAAQISDKLKKSTWNVWADKNLLDRLSHYNIPSVSIAVIENSKIDSITCEGFANGTDKAKSSTLYQVASLSKPVFAALFSDAIAKQGFSLEDNVSSLGLEAQSLGIEDFHFALKISEILSHCAGLNVGGFSGYVAGSALPSTIDIIRGLGASKTPRLASVHLPGIASRYSGGGYLLLQRIYEIMFSCDINEHLMKCFDLHNLSSAMFGVYPKHDDFASGAHSYGEFLNSGHLFFPEFAAAGLWASIDGYAEIARKLIFHMRNPVIDGSTASISEASSIVKLGRSALYFKVVGSNENVQMQHSGRNRGYCSKVVIWPGSGNAVIVLTNGDNAVAMIEEIIDKVMHERGWISKSFESTFDPVKVDALKIGYASHDGIRIELEPSKDDAFSLIAKFDRSLRPLTLKQIGRGLFSSPELDLKVRADPDTLSEEIGVICGKTSRMFYRSQ